jgi:uncharacterized protein
LRLVSWVLRGAEVIASVEIATSRQQRRRGLLGRDQLDGALLLQRTRWVHTIGMKFAIDVAHLDREGVVIAISTMPRHRIGAIHRKAASVLEAEAGSFARWGIKIGDRLELRA